MGATIIMPTTIPVVKGKMPGWSLRSAELLKKEHNRIKDKAFYRGFKNKPASLADFVFQNFKEGYIYFYDQDWRAISDSTNKEFFNPDHPSYINPDWRRYTGCDLSGKKRPGTVLFTIAIAPNGTRHVLDVIVGKMNGSQFADALESVFEDPKLTPYLVYVENNGLQEYAQDLIRERGYSFQHKIRGFHTGSKKTDPEIGLPVIETQYSNRMWRMAIPHSSFEIVKKDLAFPGTCMCGRCIFKRATVNFTEEDLYDNTPDTVMAQWMAKEASRKKNDFSASGQASITITNEQIRDNTKKIAKSENKFRIPIGQENITINKSVTWFGKNLNGFMRQSYTCPICQSCHFTQIVSSSEIFTGVTKYCINCKEDIIFQPSN